jgi:two-component system cell cycle response regulator
MLPVMEQMSASAESRIMSGHILIVEGDAERRARLQGAVRAAHLPLECCADPSRAPARLRAGGPALLLLDAGDGGANLVALDSRPANVPAIVLVPAGDDALRLAALARGAEDVMTRDPRDRLLQARLRSLLRAREAQFDLAPAAAGLAEGAAPFAGAPAAQAAAQAAARIAVIAAGGAAAPHPALPGLAARLGCAETEDRPGGAPDLAVLDAHATQGDLEEGAQVLEHLAALRSRAGARHAATLVLLPEGAVQTAALALDLGADDVVAAPVTADEVVLRARALLRRKAQADRLRARLRSHLEAALHDPLTGLHNRRHAEPELRRLMAEGRRAGRPVALMLLDIDHFKGVNDRHGHAAGDRVLAEVARRLRARLRPGDLLARMGGEEFLVALPGTDAAQARAVAEGLRRAVEDCPFPLDDAAPRARRPGGWAGPERGPAPRQVRVTLSIGVAAATPADLSGGLTDRGLQDRADVALYAAKNGGRNMVSVAVGAA